MVRSLKGGNTAPSPRNVVLEHEGKTVASDLRKADLYVRQYAGVSCHRFTKEERGRKREVKKAFIAHRRAERGNDERGEPVDQDFFKSEFEAALRVMKKAGAEGPDGIAQANRQTGRQDSSGPA